MALHSVVRKQQGLVQQTKIHQVKFSAKLSLDSQRFNQHKLKQRFKANQIKHLDFLLLNLMQIQFLVNNLPISHNQIAGLDQYLVSLQILDQR